MTSPTGQCDSGSTQHSCSHREGILVVRRICSLLRTAGTADPGPGLDTPEQQLLLVTRGIHCNASHGLFLSRAELPAVSGIASPAKEMDTALSAQRGRDEPPGPVTPGACRSAFVVVRPVRPGSVKTLNSTQLLWGGAPSRGGWAAGSGTVT